MRKLIHELLEPHIHRGMEDRDFTQQLKKSLEVQKRRISDLQYSVFKTNQKPSAFDEITNKFHEIVSKKLMVQETERKVENAKVLEEIEKFREDMNTLKREMSDNTKLINKIDTQGNELYEKLAEFAKTLADYKTLFLGEVNKINDFIKSENEDLRTAIARLDDAMQHNESHLKKAQLQVNEMEGNQKAMTSEVGNLHSEIQRLMALKVEEDKYQKDLGFFREEHLRLKYALQDFNNRQHTTDNFIEKYVPLRIQSQISETLAAVVGRREKKKLFDFEQYKLQELHNYILDDSGKPDLGRQIRTINTKYNIEDPNDVKGEGEKPDRNEESKHPSHSPTVQSKVTLYKNESIVSGGGSPVAKGIKPLLLNTEGTEELGGGDSIETKQDATTPGQDGPEILIPEQPASPIKVIKQSSMTRIPKTRTQKTLEGVGGIDEEDRYTHTLGYTSTSPGGLDTKRLKEEILEDLEEMFTKQEMNFKKIDYKLADMRGEVAGNIERTEQEVKKLVEESHTYLQSLHGELDGFVKKRKNDKKQLKGELETIEKKVNGILDGEIVINQAIETIAVVLACMVENISVQQALEMQQEEDLKTGMFTASTQSSARRQIPFALRQQALSATSGSQLSGDEIDPNSSLLVGSVKEKPPTYSPSNVTYRKFSFNRSQLISIRTHLLFRCKDVMNVSYPFKDKSITPRQFFDELNLSQKKPEKRQSIQHNQSPERASSNLKQMPAIQGTHVIPSIPGQESMALGSLNRSMEQYSDQRGRFSGSYGGTGPLPPSQIGIATGRGVIYQHRAKNPSRAKASARLSMGPPRVTPGVFDTLPVIDQP